MASKEEKTVLLKVELDVKALKETAKAATVEIERLKAAQAAAKAETGTNTVEYAKLSEELRQAQKALRDSASALAINEKLNKGLTGSVDELKLAQKALTTEYNSLSQEERENSAAGQQLTKTLKQVTDALIAAGEKVGDNRRKVGDYEGAIRKVLGEIKELKKEQGQVSNAIGYNTQKLEENQQALDDLQAKGLSPLDAEYKAIQKEVEFYTEALVTNQETLNQVNAELVQQEAVLDATAREAQKIGFVYGNNANAAESLKKKIAELKAEIATLDFSDPRRQQAIEEAAEFQDKLQDINETIKAQAAGSGFEKLSNTFSQLKEDLLNLDFEGVAEKAKSLEEISKRMTFKETISGLKAMGQSLISLGRAILANPLFLIIGVIAAVTAAVVVLTGSTRDLEAENEALNASYEKSIFFLDLLVKKSKDKADFDLELAKLQGKSAKEIRDMRLDQIDQEEADNEERIRRIMAQQKKLRKQEADAVDEGNTELQKKIQEQSDELQKEFLTRINDRDTYYQKAILVDEEFYQAEKKLAEDAAKEAADKRREAQRKFLDETRAAAEKIRQLTLENYELTAENERKANDAMAAFRRNIAEAEIKDAREKAAMLLAIDEEYYAKDAEIDQKEKAARLARIESDAAEELKVLKGTAEQKAEQRRLIEELTERQIEALNTEFDAREIERAKQISDARAAAEKISIDEINRLNEERLLRMEANLEHEETLLREQGLKEIDIAKKTAARRIEIAKFENQVIQEDATKSDAEKLKAAADLERDLLNIRQEGMEAQKELDAQELSNRQQIIDATLNGAAQLADSLFGIKQNQIEAEQIALQKGFEAQQEALDKQLASGVISQAKYAEEQIKLQKKQKEEEGKLKREAYRKQRAADLIQAGNGIALAVINALQTKPFVPVGLTSATLAGALGLAQLAEIATSPEPAFASGGRVLSGQRIGAGDGRRVTRANGDNLLATVRTGEVILNERQQAALGGSRTFARIGVPGFADGGATGIVAGQLSGAVDAEFQTESLIDAIGKMKFVTYIEDVKDGLDRVNQVESSGDIF